MAKKKKVECPAGEKWAVPYADFLSLLLALFIALYAISAVNTAKAEALKQELIKIFDFPNTRSVQESKKPNQAQKQNDNIAVQIRQMDNAAIEQNTNNERYIISLDQTENQVAIDMPTGVKFDALSYDIYDPDMINFIKIISMIVQKTPPSVSIEIRGYADDYNDASRDYQLAGNRAQAVLNALLSNGVPPNRLRFASYGNSAKALGTESQKVAKIYFKMDMNDRKAQQSVLDILATQNSAPATPTAPSAPTTPSAPTNPTAPTTPAAPTNPTAPTAPATPAS